MSSRTSGRRTISNTGRATGKGQYKLKLGVKGFSFVRLIRFRKVTGRFSE